MRWLIYYLLCMLFVVLYITFRIILPPFLAYFCCRVSGSFFFLPWLIFSFRFRFRSFVLAIPLDSALFRHAMHAYAVGEVRVTFIWQERSINFLQLLIMVISRMRCQYRRRRAVFASSHQTQFQRLEVQHAKSMEIEPLRLGACGLMQPMKSLIHGILL